MFTSQVINPVSVFVCCVCVCAHASKNVCFTGVHRCSETGLNIFAFLSRIGMHGCFYTGTTQCCVTLKCAHNNVPFLVKQHTRKICHVFHSLLDESRNFDCIHKNLSWPI